MSPDFPDFRCLPRSTDVLLFLSLITSLSSSPITPPNIRSLPTSGAERDRVMHVLLALGGCHAADVLIPLSSPGLDVTLNFRGRGQIRFVETVESVFVWNIELGKPSGVHRRNWRWNFGIHLRRRRGRIGRRHPGEWVIRAGVGPRQHGGQAGRRLV